MPVRRVAASVATPVVTGNHGVIFEHPVSDGQQRCAVQLCEINRFAMVNERSAPALVLPNPSIAIADTDAEPLNTVVEGHDTVHGGVVEPFFFVP